MNELPAVPNPSGHRAGTGVPLDAEVISGLSGTRMLTDEMNFVDSMDALNRVNTRENWYRAIGAKPIDAHSNPYSIQIEFTQRCNLTCAFCYNDSSPKNTDELDLETLDRVVGEVIDLAPGEVIISGGEPLMRPDHLRLLLERFSHTDIPVHILTNGMLIDHDWLDAFERAGVVTLQVSLDGGVPDVHDRVRGRKGAWAKALRGLAMAHGAGFHTFVSAVLTRENVSTLPSLVEAAYLCGCDNLNVGDLITWGRGDPFMAGSLELGGACTNDQFDWAAEYLMRQRELHRDRMEIRLAVNMYFYICQLKLKGQEGILIRGDGTVRPHCTLSGIVIGNVKEKPLREIWRDDLARLHESAELDAVLAEHEPVATNRLRQLRCYRRLPT